MRINTIKSLFFIAVMYSALFAFGQTNMRFYATLEDYKNDKFIPGYKIKDWDLGSSLQVETPDGIKKLKIKDLPSQLIQWNRVLFRLVDKEVLAVLYTGSFCVYQRYVHINGEFYSFYSEGIKGELKKWKQSDFEEYLAKAGLLEQYKKELKENNPGDSRGERHIWKEKTLPSEYFPLINEKLK